jgi:DNA-binding winged helix-turn-helix (wHTH) protein
MRLAFLGFVLDTHARELARGADLVRLSPKAYRLLEHLMLERPRAVNKQELMERLWPGTFVVEANLSNLVGEVRAALDDDAKTPRAIRTVSRFGYAFIAPVTATEADAPRGAPMWEIQSAHGRVGLAEGAHLIGRGDEVSVRLDSSRVSRVHARVTVSGDGVIYEDLGSKNGTFVDGRRIEGTLPVADRQTLVIGDVDVTFRKRRQESTATMAATARRHFDGSR